MGLFYNNDVAGKGIAKNGAKKKPFFRFWELFANKFWVFFQLNLIYILFCLPVVTFGPATAALTAMMRNIYLERPQFIWHDYVQYFKKNFKQSFFIGIIDVAAAVVFIMTFIQYSGHENMDTATKVLYWLSTAAQVLFLLMNFYIYPQIAALDLRMGGIIKNSAILMFVNLPAELIVLAFLMGFVALLLYFTLPMLFLLPFLPGAWLVFLSVFCCYPAIQRLIINPFYESRGEINPEIPDWELDDDDFVDDDDDEDEVVFTDQGGKEEPIDLRAERKRERQNAKSKGKGRVIK